MDSKIAGIIVALLIGGGILWMKSSDKSENSQDLRNLVYEVLETADNFDKYESEYQMYFDLYHDEVFDANYRMGGRRTGPSFDEEAYWTEMFTLMIRSADADGETEVADGLRSLRDQLL